MTNTKTPSDPLGVFIATTIVVIVGMFGLLVVLAFVSHGRESAIGIFAIIAAILVIVAVVDLKLRGVS